MQMEFRKQPIYNNYEASSDGTVRNSRLKQPLGNVGNNGYKIVRIYKTGEGKTYYSHRFVFECYHGPIQKGLVVDHINRDKLDNRVEILRAVTPSENSRNTTRIRQKLPPSPVIAVMDADEIEFPSIYSAANYFDINTASVYRNINFVTKTVYSEKYDTFLSFYEPV